MDWGDIKGFIGEAAPIIGSLLPIPGGAAVGTLVAKALGVKDDPDEVARAIRQNPEALLKLKQLEHEHERELKGMLLKAETNRMEQETARLAEINQTMRAELEHEGIYKSGWRPGLGWVLTFSIGGLLSSLVYAIFTAPSTAPEVISNATVIISLMLGVLGVNVTSRSNDKKTTKGISQPGLIASIAERIRKGPSH